MDQIAVVKGMGRTAATHARNVACDLDPTSDFAKGNLTNAAARIVWGQDFDAA